MKRYFDFKIERFQDTKKHRDVEIQREKEEDRKTERFKEFLFAVYLLCVLCARYDLLLDTEGLCNTSCDSCATMTENKCCASMACGWCVAQTLLLTRRSTSSTLAS